VGVAHGSHVDFLIVLADLGGQLGWVFVPAGARGAQTEPQAGLDPSMAPTKITFTDVRVPRSNVVSDHSIPLERVLAIGAVATAAEGLGAASRALDLAVEYSLERRQFGRLIGSFQALQHVLADAHVLRETAWSTILYASAALDESTAGSLEAASIAKAHASRASRDVVEAALQVLGGVAFTWEHDAHLFQRRVLECERRFGDSLHHEGVLADMLLPAPMAVAS
jgi:alkylation response protein AidB-like acyl-CoA dehydrogenase